MEESVTYQPILEEGITRGVVRGMRQVLLRQGTRRFGPPDRQTLAVLEVIAGVPRLEELSDRLETASSWHDLLGTTPPAPRRRRSS